ncbi:MAG: hypothetical protein R6U02_06570 [Alkalibacterium sp.]|uniref:hypothetical protein n=1 Tax=Alkalibacterium sp. TaxID=1872447 RepID=UPI003970514F
MIIRGIIASLFLIFATVMTFSACDVISEKGLDESLDKVPDVTLIKGAENASVRVNRGTTSNFSIDIDNVEWNNLISNGEREAYCIAWKDPISSNNDIYEGVGVYSTAGDKQFDDVNRLFSMKNALLKADPEITWREIQVAVWSLIPFQEFDMNMPADELPDEVRSNGEANFDKGKVQFILDAVQNRSTAKTAEFSGLMNSEDEDSEKTMCVIGTDGNTQTLIVPCDETAFAYGGSETSGIGGEVDNDKDSDTYQQSLDPYAHCFPDDDDIDDTRWGWTNGKLTEGTYNFPLYAGAGQCDLSKGQITGNVEIVYEGTTVTVTFTSTDDASFYKEDGTTETHLYVGSEKMPPKGAAPGEYPNNGDLDVSSESEVKYVVNDVSGDIYVIAHAVMGTED